MEWTDDYYYMMLRVLTTNRCHPVADWMGLGYICFAEDMDAYDPEKGTCPVTYYAYRLRERIQRERRYGGLIHTPVVRQRAGVESSIVGLDTPLGASKDDGSAMTLLDVLEGSTEAENAEEREQAMWLSLVDDIYSDLTPSEKKCIPYIKRAILGEDGAVAPRPMRAMMWRLRKKLLDAKKALDRD